MKITMKVPVAFALLFACCASTYGQQPAEEQKKKPAVELFETVIVNADMEQPEVPESPTTISEVTAAEIQQRNVTNIGQALELLPGVQFCVLRSEPGLVCDK